MCFIFKQLTFFSVILFSVLLCSCRIEKKLYASGYYIESFNANSSKILVNKTNVSPEKNKLYVLDSEKTIPISTVIAAAYCDTSNETIRHIAETKVITGNTTATTFHSTQITYDNLSRKQLFKKTNDKTNFHSNITRLLAICFLILTLTYPLNLVLLFSGFALPLNVALMVYFIPVGFLLVMAVYLLSNKKARLQKMDWDKKGILKMKKAGEHKTKTELYSRRLVSIILPFFLLFFLGLLLFIISFGS